MKTSLRNGNGHDHGVRFDLAVPPCYLEPAAFSAASRVSQRRGLFSQTVGRRSRRDSFLKISIEIRAPASIRGFVTAIRPRPKPNRASKFIIAFFEFLRQTLTVQALESLVESREQSSNSSQRFSENEYLFFSMYIRTTVLSFLVGTSK